MMGECAILRDTQTAQGVSTTGTHGPFFIRHIGTLLAAGSHWALIGDVLHSLGTYLNEWQLETLLAELEAARVPSGP